MYEQTNVIWSKIPYYWLLYGYVSIRVCKCMECYGGGVVGEACVRSAQFVVHINCRTFAMYLFRIKEKKVWIFFKLHQTIFLAAFSSTRIRNDSIRFNCVSFIYGNVEFHILYSNEWLKIIHIKLAKHDRRRRAQRKHGYIHIDISVSVYSTDCNFEFQWVSEFRCVRKRPKTFPKQKQKQKVSTEKEVERARHGMWIFVAPANGSMIQCSLMYILYTCSQSDN